MKVIIEFSKEDASEEAIIALNGYKWKNVVSQIDLELRDELKYNEKLHKEVRNSIEKLRNNIREIMSDYGLNLD